MNDITTSLFSDGLVKLNVPLPPGYRFGSLEILDVLGKGGSGIVYRALDHDDGQYLTIKEYLPAMLAQRDAMQSVRCRETAQRAAYEKGMHCFLQNALVAKELENPWLLKCHAVWQANNTAYYSAPLYQGKTLQALIAQGNRPDEIFLRRLLTRLFSALSTMHHCGYVHGDICMDNILIQPRREPLILDLGSLRKIEKDPFWHTQKALRPGYAPIEQYLQEDEYLIGPWTDIYAVGALLHLLITGTLPAISLSRAIEDDRPPLVEQSIPGYSRVLLTAVDKALSIDIKDRPQSIEQLADDMVISIPSRKIQ